MENYFDPKSNIRIKSSIMGDLKLLLEFFFPQTFIALSVVYTFFVVVLSNYNFSIELQGQSIDPIEIYLLVTLPIIIISLYRKFGLITFPSFANGIYHLLYQDYEFSRDIDFIFFAINERIIFLLVFAFVGINMAYYRIEKFTEDAIIVYYIGYLAIIISVLMEFLEKGGSGVLVIFLILFVTIFIMFMFQTVAAFTIGFLIGLFLIRKRIGKYKSRFLYPRADGFSDTQYSEILEY